MATAILCACVSCGAEFKFNKHKSNKYCSADCYRTAQRRGDYKRGHGPEFPRVPCTHCGAEVRRNFSTCRDGSKSDKLFCGRDCYDAYRKSDAHREPRYSNVSCAGCGKEFSKLLKSSRAYCGDACWRAKRKAKPKHCVNCGCWFTPMKLNSMGQLISVNAHKTCSRECHLAWYRNNEDRKQKISAAFAGPNHPLWKGGMAHQQLGYRGTNWQTQRAKALKRDGYCCVDCGMTDAESLEKYGEGLSVDHVVPYHNFGNYKEANRLSNLESRCKACHRTAESKRTMCQMVLPLNGKRHHQHRGYKAGSAHPKARLSESDVIAIRRRADAGDALKDIGRAYGMQTTTISSIVSGKTWRNLPLGKTAGHSRLVHPPAKRGEDSPMSRLTGQQVMDMRIRAAAGERIQAIADSVGETYASVYQIVRGKSWKHLPVFGYTTRRGGKMPTCSS